MFKKLTPIWVVDEIEPCLDFWVNRFGFAMSVSVPEGEKLGFAILTRDNAEIMYQTRDSLRKDIPNLAAHPLEGSAIAYIELESLDEILAKLDGLEVALPLRQTFYGAHEIGVWGPSDRLIIFAAPVASATVAPVATEPAPTEA